VFHCYIPEKSKYTFVYILIFNCKDIDFLKTAKRAVGNAIKSLRRRGFSIRVTDMDAPSGFIKQYGTDCKFTPAGTIKNSTVKERGVPCSLHGGNL
jgi:hypothetical protein